MAFINVTLLAGWQQRQQAKRENEFLFQYNVREGWLQFTLLKIRSAMNFIEQRATQQNVIQKLVWF